ncbi:MAG: hypothetical protein M1833_004009 [Piccolia ochrophora]|nr:MAG: hypothetical protein M1833_004009 [Piccolia ochrophora]
MAQGRDNCTVALCGLEETQVGYVPNLGGNAFYLAFFAVLIPPHVYLLIRYRTWGFGAAMVLGLMSEVAAYAGRVMLYSKPFGRDPFLSYIVPSTFAPAFFTAAIYLCLARLVVSYGEHFSRLAPRLYTIIFITCDFIALLLQAIGGAMASTADTEADGDLGVNLMISGLAFQVFSLVLFITLCSEFAWRVYKNKNNLNSKHEHLRSTNKFRAFHITLAIATLTIFIRCVFRVAELSEGFDGALATDQVTFMILEGAMVAIACIALTALHPGVAFQGSWKDSNFKLGGKKKLSDKDGEVSPPVESV